MFSLAPDGIDVITDTLATTEGVPYLFASKSYLVPHLGMVVAFTGWANIGQRWAADVHSNMVCRDIDMLDQFAPDGLRRINAQVEAEFGPLSGSTTVYHFGVSEDRKTYVAYAYRSAADFVSEQLAPNGFGVKPPPLTMPTNPPSEIRGYIELAEQIKAEQENRDASSRLYIGGELVVVHLTEGLMVVAKIHRFADFEADWLAMNARLPDRRTDDPDRPASNAGD